MDSQSELSLPEPHAGFASASMIEAEVYAGAIRTRYLRAGDGPVVVLLHGADATPEAWAPLIGSLSPRFRVIAPDVTGDGGRDGPSAVPGPPSVERWLRDFLDGLGLERVNIIGSCEGAVIALRFASEYPDRVERLVLIGSARVDGEASRPFSPERLRDYPHPTLSLGDTGDGSCFLTFAGRSAYPDIPDGLSGTLIRFLSGESGDRVATTIPLPRLIKPSQVAG